MSVRRLSSLPAELICLILQEINSTRDLYSFIRTSSQIHAAFITLKEQVLSSLLERAVSAEVLRRDAQITLKSSQFPFPKDCRISENVTQLSAFPHFFQNSEKPDIAEHGFQLELSIPLCKLHSGIEYLVEDYCTYVMRENYAGCLQSPDAPSTNSRMIHRRRISETELLRLQRAFYRYNTCQNMMRAVMSPQVLSEQVYSKLADLLSAFTPWEVEEIGCVHDYILRRLDLVTQQLEEVFIRSVVDADWTIRQNEKLMEQASVSPGARLKCLSKILHPEKTSEEYHCLGYSQSLFEDGRPEDFFSIQAKRYRPSQMKALATLGAPFMRTLLLSDSKSKMELICRHEATYSYDLHDALQNSFPSGHFFSVEENAELWNHLISLQGESAGQPNKAWLWSRENNWRNGIYLPWDRDLRALGYVFWDDDRLQEMRFMEEPRPNMRLSSHWRVRPLLEQHERPSAEQRLRDMGLV